jgi:hypothetical protein
LTYDVVVDDREFRRAPPPQRKKLRDLGRRLREEPFVGDRIRRELVPAPFRHLPNLYRLELPDGWRALYAVTTNEVTGDAVRIVWIGDHKRYERLFGF